MAVVTTHAYVGLDQRRVALTEYGVPDAGPVDNSPPVLPAELSASGHGELTDNLPIQEIEASFDGWKAPSFLDDYYYRVHVRPGVIELGNLLSTQVRDVEVWSAYFEPQLLSSLSQVGTDGITLTQPQVPPTSFAALEARTYTLNISTNGAPVINALYTFNFQTDHPTLTVTGRRVVVWPFMPQTKHKEMLEWQTDIIPSYAGEQRLALRAEPRQTFNYTYMLTPEEFSRAKAISYQWAHRVYGVPVWSELTHVGPLPIGTTYIPVDTTVADYRENDVIIIWESSSSEMAVDISTVQAGSVSLKLPLSREFTSAYVAPLRFARAYAGIEYSRSGNDVVISKATFAVTQNKDLSASIGYPTYRGKDVVTDRTIVVGNISEKLFRPIDVFDNGSGPVEVDTQSDWVEHRQVLTFSTKNRVERWRARQWLHRLKGKQGTFWLISWNRDLEVTADFNSTSTGLVVKAIGYPTLYGVKDIMIQLKSGTRVFNRVLSGTSSEGGTETISLASQIGVTATVSDVDMVCFMSHVRLDSDSIEISHEYSGQVSINVSVVEVPE